MKSCLHPRAILIIVSMSLCLMPKVAHAMTYSVSVYGEAWGEDGNPTLYFYGDVSDNSEFGSCGHSNYYTIAHLVSPSGRRVDYGSSGLSVNTSLSLDSEEGDWDAYTTGTLSCSCMPGTPVGYGGAGPPITAFTANYAKTGDYSESCAYWRCGGGDCSSASGRRTLFENGICPAFVKFLVLRVGLGIGSLCFFSAPIAIPSCSS